MQFASIETVRMTQETNQQIFPCLDLSNIHIHTYTHTHTYIYIYIYIYTQGVPGGMCQTSGECSLGQTIPI